MNASNLEVSLTELSSKAAEVLSMLVPFEREYNPNGVGRHSELISSFIHYIEAVTASAQDGSFGMGVTGPKVPTHPFRAIANDETTRLRALCSRLSEQLEVELRAKSSVLAQQTRLAQMLEELRLERDLSEVLRQRLTEITKQPAPEGKPLQLPIRHQTQEVASELGRIAAIMKDKYDRSQAECLKLKSDKAALLAENALLFEKANLLQEQLYSLSQSASMNIRQLAKERINNAQALISAKDPLERRTMTPNPTNVFSGSRLPSSGQIEPEMAVWLKDMYVTLSNAPETTNLMHQTLKSEKPKQSQFSTHVGKMRDKK